MDQFRTRPLNEDGLVRPAAATGFVAMDSPNDRQPEFEWDGVRVVRLDGKTIEQFELIDHFLARHAFGDPAATAEVLALPLGRGSAVWGSGYRSFGGPRNGK